MSEWRDATSSDLAVLWPAVRSAHIFSSPEQLATFSADSEWRVRVAADGAALVLRRWRAHLDILSIRVAWAPTSRIPDVVCEARRLAREHGFARVISPLLAGEALQAYVRGGMNADRELVAFQASPRRVLDDLAARVTTPIRRATEDDFEALLALDAACFEEFWRYGEPELTDAYAWERITVAEDDGRIIGYASAAVSGSACTLGRLAVEPAMRRQGVAASLIADVASYAVAVGALGLSLCTQLENGASRSLYTGAGFLPVGDVYAIAIVDA